MTNQKVFNGLMGLENIDDGSANTMFWAEGYTRCQQVTVSGANTYKRDYTRAWNYDPYRAQANQYVFDAGSKTYDYTVTPSITAPWFAALANAATPFDHMPKPDNCDYTRGQSTTPAGLLVGMGDGSVRTVSPSVSVATFFAAFTPASGDSAGSDW